MKSQLAVPDSLSSGPNLFSRLRSQGRRHPRLRAALSPAWSRIAALLWTLRRAWPGDRPIVFAAAGHQISMVPGGQIAECLWRGAFEESERDFAAREIQPGMRVLNIGANAGLYTLIASRLAGPDGMVHAFEPASQNFDLLRKNLDLNRCANVVANRIALSDFEGELSLNSDPLHPGLDGHFYVRSLSESAPDAAAPLEIVPCTTLDAYWHAVCGGELKPVDFLVIDVEGAELSVFQGARQTIAASPHLTMILECTANIAATSALLGGMGFSFYQWNQVSARLMPAQIAQGSFIAHRVVPHVQPIAEEADALHASAS
jgi:FkbM family methyltransferase